MRWALVALLLVPTAGASGGFWFDVTALDATTAAGTDSGTDDISGFNQVRCRGGEVRQQAAWGGFRFFELPEERGCGIVHYPLEAPQGATALLLEFSADRRVDHATSPINPEGRLQQELILAYEDGPLAAEDFARSFRFENRTPYFHPGEGTRDLQGFAFELPVQRPGPMQLVWFWRDTGAEGAAGIVAPASGVAFGASLRDIEANFRVALADGDALQGASSLELTLPADLSRRGGVFHWALPPELTVRSLKIDGRSVPLESITLQSFDDRIIYRVPVAPGEGAQTLRLQVLDVLATPATAGFPWGLFGAAFPLAGLIAAVYTRRGLYRDEARKAHWRFPAEWWLASAVGVSIGLVVMFSSGQLVHGLTHPTSLSGVEVQTLFLLLGGLLFVTAALYHAEKRRQDTRRHAEQLAEANRRLSLANADLKEFAHVASHDLNSPLRVIHGFSELVESDSKSRLSDDAKQFLEHIRSGSIRMQNLVESIRDFSRLERQHIQANPVDLEAIVTAVRVDLGVELKATNGTLTLGESGPILADATQLQQLLMNVVRNALLYTKEGQAPRVQVSARREHGFDVVCVEDDGIGIPEQDLERIKRPFERGPTRKPGSGIGLAICQRVMDVHGGRLEIRNAQGGGTLVEAWFPRRLIQTGGEKRGFTHPKA